ncbi:hypothetical protein DSO57_1004341 [Entomophthora muscae]|uniref:Uncharacterized protein n=1 Tax=Entomophthora muscae TaxID=34485 RepID=A0ACC2SKY9_9FUNG|nr:hypothetical protein DSO57_1004341 [Entomophthora muscae]
MPNCPWHHTRPAQLPTLLKPVLESIRPPLPNQFKSENQSESSLRFPKRLLECIIPSKQPIQLSRNLQGHWKKDCIQVSPKLKYAFSIDTLVFLKPLKSLSNLCEPNNLMAISYQQ